MFSTVFWTIVRFIFRSMVLQLIISRYSLEVARTSPLVGLVQTYDLPLRALSIMSVDLYSHSIPLTGSAIASPYGYLHSPPLQLLEERFVRDVEFGREHPGLGYHA